MQERSSCSVSSASHQFCTLWLQLTPSTWHAGCRIVQRPFRWLAEEQSRLWNRLLRASAIGPGHLLAVGTKDQAVGRLRATSAELGSITAFLRPYSAQNPAYPQSIFKYDICWAQFAHRLSLQTATLSLQTGRFQRPVCRLGETLAQFANWVSVCKLRQPSLQTR